MGVAVRDATWENDEGGYVELLPMMALAGITSMEKIGELLPSVASDPDGWLQNACDELHETVTSLYEYWVDDRKVMAERLAQRAMPKAELAALEVLRGDGVDVLGELAPCPSGNGFVEVHGPVVERVHVLRGGHVGVA